MGKRRDPRATKVGRMVGQFWSHRFQRLASSSRTSDVRFDGYQWRMVDEVAGRV